MKLLVWECSWAALISNLLRSTEAEAGAEGGTRKGVGPEDWGARPVAGSGF